MMLNGANNIQPLSTTAYITTAPTATIHTVPVTAAAAGAGAGAAPIVAAASTSTTTTTTAAGPSPTAPNAGFVNYHVATPTISLTKPQTTTLKRRKKYVRRACVNCKLAHAACTDGKPCKRCMELGLECIESERKPRAKRTRKKNPAKPDATTPITPTSPQEAATVPAATSAAGVSSNGSRIIVKQQQRPQGVTVLAQQQPSAAASNNNEDEDDEEDDDDDHEELDTSAATKSKRTKDYSHSSTFYPNMQDYAPFIGSIQLPDRNSASGPTSPNSGVLSPNTISAITAATASASTNTSGGTPGTQLQLYNSAPAYLIGGSSATPNILIPIGGANAQHLPNFFITTTNHQLPPNVAQFTIPAQARRGSVPRLEYTGGGGGGGGDNNNNNNNSSAVVVSTNKALSTTAQRIAPTSSAKPAEGHYDIHLDLSNLSKEPKSESTTTTTTTPTTTTTTTSSSGGATIEELSLGGDEVIIPPSPTTFLASSPTITTVYEPDTPSTPGDSAAAAATSANNNTTTTTTIDNDTGAAPTVDTLPSPLSMGTITAFGDDIPLNPAAATSQTPADEEDIDEDIDLTTGLNGNHHHHHHHHSTAEDDALLSLSNFNINDHLGFPFDHPQFGSQQSQQGGSTGSSNSNLQLQQAVSLVNQHNLFDELNQISTSKGINIQELYGLMHHILKEQKRQAKDISDMKNMIKEIRTFIFMHNPAVASSISSLGTTATSTANNNNNNNNTSTATATNGTSTSSSNNNNTTNNKGASPSSSR